MIAGDLPAAVEKCIHEQALHGEISRDAGHAFTKAATAFVEVTLDGCADTYLGKTRNHLWALHSSSCRKADHA